MAFSFQERPHILREIAHKVFDLVIIGGGITGAAVARNAALRGLSVLLVEADDFASGTSSGSSKLIHGGLRYLENYEFRLVRHAIHERESMKRLYAPLVKDLKFLFPTYRGKVPARWKLNLGLYLYDSFSGFRHPHKNLSVQQTLQHCPDLLGDDLTGACSYDDAFAEDYRLVIEIIKSAVRRGATAVSRTRVVRLEPTYHQGEALFSTTLRDETLGRGNITQYGAIDGTTKLTSEFSVTSRFVINCAGPFSDQVRALLNLRSALTLTQGVHFIISNDKLKLNEAVVLSDPEYHRIVFVIPWGPNIYIGTTDTFISQPQEARAQKADLDYILAIFHRSFKTRLKRSDILNSWAAVRPLMAAPKTKKSASALSRDFVVEENPKGILHILGGKLTSHRFMAQTALNRLPGLHLNQDPTDAEPLLATPFFQQPTLREAVENEMVLSTMDYVRRRSPIYYHEPDKSMAFRLSEELRDLLGADSTWQQHDRQGIERDFSWDQDAY